MTDNNLQRVELLFALDTDFILVILEAATRGVL